MNSPRTPSPVVGLVGGIGAGKSTAAAALAELGCVVLDADAIGHRLLDDQPVRQAIVDRWGRGVLNAEGRIDRPAVAERVFADRRQLSILESILHPRIAECLREQIAQARTADPPAVVVDAAVLFEAGWDRFCDAVVFVEAQSAERLRRVQASRGWSAGEWSARENSQIALDIKRLQCDYRLRSSSRFSHLKANLQRLLCKM